MDRLSQVKDLLEDVRIALERDPHAAREAALQLVTHLSRSIVTRSTRGGLAPWQKRKIDRYLSERLGRSLRVEELASQVGLSVSYFGHAFKESFGSTPHSHIERLRLEQAQRLMLGTDEPLSRIALICGFADQAHFSRRFRRTVGDTPSAWRRRNLTEEQIARREIRLESGSSVRTPA